MPIFADAELHGALIRALELHVRQSYGRTPDVIVGLEARGFLFGPSLALRLGASFVPVRKKGKLPGPCETEGFVKEYGEDFFQMQSDAVKPGQSALVVDDIIATGKSRRRSVYLCAASDPCIQVAQLRPPVASWRSWEAISWATCFSWNSTSSKDGQGSPLRSTPSSLANSAS